MGPRTPTQRKTHRVHVAAPANEQDVLVYEVHLPSLAVDLRVEPIRGAIRRVAVRVGQRLHTTPDHGEPCVAQHKVQQGIYAGRLS